MILQIRDCQREKNLDKLFVKRQIKKYLRGTKRGIGLFWVKFA